MLGGHALGGHAAGRPHRGQGLRELKGVSGHSAGRAQWLWGLTGSRALGDRPSGSALAQAPELWGGESATALAT